MTAASNDDNFDIFDAFATDENLEDNGAIFPLGKKGGATLLVARAGNRAYGRELNKQIDENRLELDSLDDKVKNAASDRVMVSVIAKTILLGWNKLSLAGKDVGVYSVEKAEELLRIRDFRKHVAKCADDTDAYKLKREVETGNV